MKTQTVLALLLAPLFCAAAPADPATADAPAAPPAAAPTNSTARLLAARARFAPSVVAAAWRFRLAEDGTCFQPEFKDRGLPSALLSPRFADEEDGFPLPSGALDFVSLQRSFLRPAFALAPDRFLVRDPMFRTAGVERVSIVLPDGRAFAARPVASFPERRGLLFATDEPIPGVVPLAFDGDPDPAGAFSVLSNGPDTPLGVCVMKDWKPTEALSLAAAPGLLHFALPAETLLLDAEGRAVTVLTGFAAPFPPDGSPDGGAGAAMAALLAPPHAWEEADPFAAEETERALEKRLALGVLPVFLRFDPRAREEGYARRGYHESDEDERDLYGFVLRGGRVLIPTPAEVDADALSRLDKVEATLPGGGKAELRFEGALRDYDAVVAAFDGGVPEGVEPLAFSAEPPTAALGTVLHSLGVDVQADALRLRMVPVEIDPGDFFRFRADRVFLAEEEPLFDGNGALVQLSLNRRMKTSHYLNSLTPDLLRGVDLADAFPPYDPEIVPRTGRERIRETWLGVDVQRLTKDVAREKKALAWIGVKQGRGADTEGALVSNVYPGSPAERIGLKEGDVLLYVRSEDGVVRCALEKDRSWGGSGGGAPWHSVSEDPGSRFASFGIGATVVVEWLSDGVFREAPLVVETAPKSFRSATRARMKDLGLIVADLTFEVREYFRLPPSESGVVVVRVKNGSPADVAGLRPFELVTGADGAPVKDARDFLERVRGRGNVTLAVRRLTESRVVQLSAPPEAADKK